MIRALGYSHNTFRADDPGRLCRGRERWIEPFELDEPSPEIHRLVLTGAEFSDDSAADAKRGLPHAGLDIATVLTTLFTRKSFVAFMEDGHPADIPEDAVGVEMYEGFRAGGRSEALFVRWFKEVSGLRELRDVLGPDPDGDRVRGFVVLDPDVELDEELRDRFFLLVGMGTLDSPPARFQPAALPEILSFARAVVLLHRDKQGPAIGVYSREPLKVDGRLETLCEKGDTLLVRFEIPPMLARWDRALAEARTIWESTRSEPFPVPVAPESSQWQPRRRRRRNERDDEETPILPEEVEDEAVAADEFDSGVDEESGPDEDDDDGEFGEE